MCDTMIAMADVTANGRTLLAKNSDREPNEAQYLNRADAADHPPGVMVQMTYVAIPQVAHTHALVGSRPWWMWGFEHGVNEHGLAIGNEAVWSRLPAGRENGLLGMDLLRLTLERAATADEALGVLTDLLQRHGQSGSCAMQQEMFYHNAFILADAGNAWVLETAGHHWVAKRVRGWASISNVYSIGSDYDLISDQAIAFAVGQGWHQPGHPFDWAASYTDTQLRGLAGCKARHVMAQAGMTATTAGGKVTLANMFTRLRDHGDVPQGWRPAEDAQSMICMHAHDMESGSQTVASMVAELGAGQPPRLWCSLGAPCLSAFTPVWLDTPLPQGWEQPAEGDDAWWQLTRLQRAVERDYAGTAPYLRAAFDALEVEALAAVPQTDGPAPDRADLVQRLALAQRGAVLALTATIDTLQNGPLSPRPEEPRGAYLLRVAAEAPQTQIGSTLLDAARRSRGAVYANLNSLDMLA